LTKTKMLSGGSTGSTGTSAQRSPDVDAYLASVPDAARLALAALRSIIAGAAPEAVERMAYGVPGFQYRKRPLVAFGAAKAHAGFYGMSATVFDAMADELSSYGTSKGTVRFSYDEPIPAALVTKIVKARIAEIDAAEAKRAAAKRKR